jgi:hypothetical protein
MTTSEQDERESARLRVEVENLRREVGENRLALILLRRERERAERKIHAHHELSTLSDEVIREFDGRCPVCAGVE